MAYYTEYPALGILDDLNPAPLNAASMNLDDSEEEVELEDNAYAAVEHADMVARNEEEEEEEEEVEGDCEEESHNTSRATVRDLDRELPPPPRFRLLIHPSPEHTRYLTLPSEFSSCNTTASTDADSTRRIVQLTPGSFFQLHFPDTEFNTLAENTNAYAEYKNTGLYWEGSHEFPVHDIMRYMSKFRFEQLKRYFHVVSVTVQSRSQCHWTEKLQPLARNLEERFQAYMVPGSSVAIDEMMAKPIPQGFKMLALYE
ncbi:hypothetical protein C7212DRAFT_343328 [Tuber magnatum]|uniref:PiggyBac transposable element-derived protein domain-containing protein n=1 Tax=Tuber magnatum TaxID=42249 RepID=A0A317SUR0_9PEZI|nr:hypothetical protein C7212DRAFT_343328 [Tuber magnatum]